MAIIQQPTNGVGQIESREVQVLGAERAARLTDDAALKLVRQDRVHGEMFMAKAQWPLQLREADVLYQSPRQTVAWQGAGAIEPNISRFTVAKHVNTLVPDMISGIFYEDPPFVLRPRPGTHQESVRAMTALCAALMDDMDLASEAEEGMESQVLNGTGIWKYGEFVERSIEKHFVRTKQPTQIKTRFGGEQSVATAASDEFKIKEVEKEQWHMFLDHVPLTEILIDPGWRKPNKIRKAKWIIHTKYPTFTDLQQLRQQAGYDIPSEEELKALFFGAVERPEAANLQEKQQNAMAGIVHHAAPSDEKTTEDPLEQPLRLDERWDKKRIITVLNDKLVVRNEEHNGSVGYLSANWWNIPNAGLGMGVGKIVGQDQRVDTGTTNAALKILSMAVNQTYLRSRSANVPTQQIVQRLGGIITVDGEVDKAFKVLEPPKVPPEVWTMLAASKDASESATGADEAFGQGKIPGRGSSVGRTATGAGGIISARASKLQGPVGRFCKNVFVPFIRIMMERIRERMPMAQIRQILGEELGEDFSFEPDNFLNSGMKAEVLAGAHMAAKKAMAQSLPWMVSILENPELVRQLHAIGWTVDVKEMFAMIQEMAEWKNSRDLVRKQSPQEAQAMQQQNPAMAKMQGDIAREDHKSENAGKLQEQRSQEDLSNKLVLTALEKASGYEEREVLRNKMKESPSFA